MWRRTRARRGPASDGGAPPKRRPHRRPRLRARSPGIRWRAAPGPSSDTPRGARLLAGSRWYWPVRGRRSGSWNDHRLARQLPPRCAFGRRAEVGRQERRRIWYALEAGYAGHVHHVRPSFALDQVDAVEVDPEGAAAAQRDVGLFGRGGERLAVLLRLCSRREHLPDTEEALADHVDLQVTPLRRMIALRQDRRLVRRARLREGIRLVPGEGGTRPASPVLSVGDDWRRV